MLSLTSDTFSEAVGESMPTIVKYWMKNCNPCNFLSPIMDKVAGETQGIAFFQVSVDEYPALAQRARLRGAPTVILYKEGQEVARFTGPMSYEGVMEFIEKNAK